MMSDQSLISALREGIDCLALPGDPQRLAQSLCTYVKLLHKWNQAYNLTAVRSMQEMVGRHMLDSLAIVPWVTGSRVLDVGSGAGLPGIPLAMACPDKQIVLLDSNGKKTRFLVEMQRALSLSNIEIVQERAENYRPDVLFDTVVTRAFADVTTMLHLTQHLLGPHGRWVAMKGPQVELELVSLVHRYQRISYQVPGVEGERYCVIIES